MPSASAWILAAFLVAGPSPDEPHVPVVVAKRPMKAGEALAIDDVAQRRVPARVVTSSIVTPENVTYVLNGKLLHSVDEGEPLAWSYFANAQPMTDQACPARTPQQPAFPPRPEQPAEMSIVLVAAREIPEGTKIQKGDLAKVPLMLDLATRFAVRWDERPLVIGERTLATIQKGDIIYFTELAAWEDPRRCELRFEAVGNLWARGGPPEAKKVRCPKGTSRLEGVPGGSEHWNPAHPGWVVTCVDGEGRNHGPWVAFERLSTKVVQRGAFASGKRTGKWESVGGKEVTSWKGGILHGPADDGIEKGLFVAGRRHGVFSLQGYAHAEFKDGHLHGTWKRDGFSCTFDGSSYKAVDEDVVQVVTAARDLAVDGVVTADALSTRDYPAAIVGDAFVRPDTRQYVLGQSTFVAVPRGAPLMWSDFVKIRVAPNPVPEKPRAKSTGN